MSLCVSFFSVTLPHYEGQLINILAMPEQRLNGFWYNLTLLFIITLFSCLFSLYINKLAIIIQTNASHDLNIYIIKKTYKISALCMGDIDSASLNQMINNDCNVLISFIMNFTKNIIVQTFTVIWIFCVLMHYSKFLCIVIVISILLYYIVYHMMKKKIYARNKEVKNNATSFFSQLYDLFNNAIEIKINSLQTKVFKKEIYIFDRYMTSILDEVNTNNIYQFFLQGITLGCQIILFTYGLHMILDKKLDVGMLIVVMNYFMKVLSSVNYFVNIGNEMQTTKVSYDRLRKYMSEKEVVYGSLKIQNFNKYTIKNISFSYSDKDYILNNVSFTFQKGRIYWLHGENGNGKSTLINLMFGVFGLDFKGDILVDEFNIRDIEYFDFLENHVAVSTQKPFLLNGDFEENILEQNNKITLDDVMYKEVLEGLDILKLAECNTGKKKLYSLIDTVSGGEKQKIALARTLLSTADILVFDEPTSSLDDKSMSFFNEYLNDLKENKIIIIISHRELTFFDEYIELVNFSKKSTLL